MSLTESNEKLVLILLLIFNLILISSHLKYLFKFQKKINFLLPSWLVVSALFLYGQFMPIYLLYAKIDTSINNTFLSVYDFKPFIIIYISYTIISILIFIVDIIFSNSIKNKGEVNKNNYNFENMNISKKYALFLTGIIAYIIFLFVFVKDYNYLSSMSGNLVFNKTERINNNVLQTKISFTNLYMVSFLFLLFSYFTFKRKLVKIFILILFLISSGFIFYMGTTLQVLLMLIAFMYFTYKFNRSLIKRYLISSVFIIPTFYFLVLFTEAYREYKLNLSSKIEISDVINFSASETVTGYLSGLVVLKSRYIMENYGINDFIFGSLPNTLRDLLNYDYTPITTLVDESEIISVFSTYVPTLPVSLLPYWYIAICVFPLFYYIINILFFSLNKSGIIMYLISAIVYIDLFYMVRINIEAALGKIRLDLILLSVFIILYIILNKIVGKFIVKRSS
ncbi:O-antigen polymerase [Staphylococcus delphini]|uniref:O-antigen polymerase n=1 Tax=Staphylococcus delphini TaxID=53344 RepID=UPI0021D0243B|nr:O-antigen polymerase [Staphylococcus delphini]UXS36969.1 oligosaccharide repeat unit polymerase [Staphylococcus delphini]UXS44436.1 oligosaccharide repeat unit polymerase [Staphylococcus delphini]UXV45061.1 oligosaccharide repeat unit polymerase [Staphylococcus delphini]